METETGFTSSSWWRLAATVGAVLLFTQASTLARSHGFRLTTGGVLATTGIALLIMMIVMR